MCSESTLTIHELTASMPTRASVGVCGYLGNGFKFNAEAQQYRTACPITYLPSITGTSAYYRPLCRLSGSDIASLATATDDFAGLLPWNVRAVTAAILPRRFPRLPYGQLAHFPEDDHLGCPAWRTPLPHVSRPELVKSSSIILLHLLLRRDFPTSESRMEGSRTSGDGP